MIYPDGESISRKDQIASNRCQLFIRKTDGICFTQKILSSLCY